MKYTIQVVSKFNGDGAVVVLQHAIAVSYTVCSVNPRMLNSELVKEPPRVVLYLYTVFK